MQKHERNIIIIAGPTAVGKTALGIEIAKRFNGEVISADSMQLYEHMDIGSATPTQEEQDGIPHHLMSIIDPKEPFSVAEYSRLAKEKIDEVFSKGKQPVIVGGTGLYLNALIYQMDFGSKGEDSKLREELERFAEANGPEALHEKLKELSPEMALKVHPNNIKRVIRAIEVASHLGEDASASERDFSTTPIPTKDYGIIFIGLDMMRLKLYARINKRVEIMMGQGLVQEVTELRDKGLTIDDRSMQGIGYKEILLALDGKITMDEAESLIKQNSRHYAKRQLTWFRRYDFVEWFQVDSFDSKDNLLDAVERYITEKLQ